MLTPAVDYKAVKIMNWSDTKSGNKAHKKAG